MGLYTINGGKEGNMKENVSRRSADVSNESSRQKKLYNIYGLNNNNDRFIRKMKKRVSR
jgi:hypothetical protein